MITYEERQELLNLINMREFPDNLMDWQRECLRGMYWCLDCLDNCLADHEIMEQDGSLVTLVKEVSTSAIEGAIANVETDILQTIIQFQDNNFVVEGSDD